MLHRTLQRPVVRVLNSVSAHAIGRRAKSESLPPFDVERSFQRTQPPSPEWEIGQGMRDDAPYAKEWKEAEEQGWKTWSCDEVAKTDIYAILTSGVIPRPIGFISTISSDGIRNLAPMSYFNLVAHNPPLLSVSFSLTPGKPKDSRENILATKQFTVSIISEPFIEAANATSVNAPPEIDEWVLSGLTPMPSTFVNPPRVKESAFAMECELYRSIDITAPDSDEVTHTLVLGLIRHIHARKAVLSAHGDTVDPAKLRPVARLGGATYARVTEGFDLARPVWKRLKDKLEKQEGKS